MASAAHTMPPARRRRRHSSVSPYLWTLPAVAFLLVFLFYPIFFNLLLSLFDWNGVDRNPLAKFIGLLNYANAFKDPIFLTALRNTLVFVFFSITLQNAVALTAAVFLYVGRFRGSTILRAVIFFPGVLSAVVVSLVWRNVVLLRGGLIPQLAQLLGVPDFFPLSNPDLAFYVIVVISIWQWTGFNFVIFYAGLQALDEDLFDAAQVDGANFWQLVFKIIVPQLWQVLLTNVILNLIGGFQVFDIVFVMTNGGPAHATEAMATYMVQKSFGQGQSRMGYAAAIASMIMIMSITFAAFRNRISRALD
jgi:raffinose/stachyose/melibiose transport system permease protein